MAEEKHICGARTKTCSHCKRRYSKDEYELWHCPNCGTERACKKPVDHADMRCKWHGGATPVKHGKYSKQRPLYDVPKRMNESYERYMESAELLNMQDNLALLYSRVQQLLNRVNIGESEQAWQDAQTGYTLLMRGLREDNSQCINDGLATLGDALARGNTDYAAWHDIQDTLKLMNTVSKTELQRRRDAAEMLNAEEARQYAQALLVAVRKVVPQDKLTEVWREFAALIGTPVIPNNQ